MALRVVTRRPDLEWSEWDDVAGASGAEIYLRSAWLEPWWTCFGHDATPHVLEVRDGDALIGGFPLLVRQRRMWAQLEAIGGGPAAADHLGPIGVDRCDVVDAAIIDHLIEQPPADLLVVDGLDADTAFARRLCAHARANGGSVTSSPCPFLVLPSSFDEYLADRSRNYRHGFRRGLRAIERSGGRFETIDTAADVEPTIEAMVRLHLAARADAPSTFRDPAMVRFHVEVSSRLFALGLLRLHRLVVDERILGVDYCWRSGAAVHAYAAGYDPAWTVASVGDQLLAYAIRSAIDEGVGTFDLLRGEEPYKLRIANGVRHDLSVTCPLTRRGRVLLGLGGAARRLRRRLRGSKPQAT
jgi:CelD/BcsL family acetyltransferase involved in cellulose biosynthesis